MAKVISVTLSEDAIQELDHLAAALGRTQAWLLEQAITDYIDEQTGQIAALEEALAEYESATATLIPHEEVAARMQELLREAGRR